MVIEKKLYAFVLGFCFLIWVASFSVGDIMAAEPKVSVKKGVGNTMGDYCDNKADKVGCNAKIADALSQLGITWYYNWYTDNNGTTKFGNIEYVPMVWGTYTDAQLNWYKAYAQSHHGSYWLIWNEPDYYRQGNILPLDAARIYKPLRDAIRSKDPNAKFIVGGMAWGWDQWAGNFVNEYKKLYGVIPPVEGWHGHLYTCNTATKDEYDINTWRTTITSFRNWINTTGGGSSKEFWLTEFGCLNYDRDQIMKEQMDWMENYDGIQRYAWFAATSKAAGATFNGGSLFYGLPETSSFGLTALGQVYAQYPLNPKPIASKTPNPTAPPTASPLLTPTPVPTVPGDTNNNGCVGAKDLGFVYGHYQSSAQCVPNATPVPITPASNGDFNHDGCVDDLDLSVVSSRFSYDCNE